MHAVIKGSKFTIAGILCLLLIEAGIDSAIAKGRAMRKIFGVLALAIALTACAGKNIKNIPPAEGLRLSCEAFAAQLNIMAPLRADGTLPANVIGIVDTQKAATDKICDAPAPAVDASVGKISVDAAITVLTSLAGQFITE